MKVWRWLDTGWRSAAENMALDEIILSEVSARRSPPTLRFLHFKMPSALVGFHQSVEHEIRRSYCCENGIEINRRITGGGAIVFEPEHLGWEIFCNPEDFPFSADRQKFLQEMSLPMTAALRCFGLPAEYRVRNDIEINGKKICGTGGTEEKDALMFQGSLLTDLDIARMLKCLRIPVEKLKNKEIDSMRERVTTLRTELGLQIPDSNEIKNRIVAQYENRFGIKFESNGLTANEIRILQERLPFYISKDWIESIKMPADGHSVIQSVRKLPGGIVRMINTIDRRGKIIQNTYIQGDFFSFPRTAINRLESILKGIPADLKIIRRELMPFFKKNELPRIGLEDFIALVDDMVRKIDLTRFGFDFEEANRLFFTGGSLESIRKCKPFRAVLLPYCAKLPGCEFRNKTGCSECGACSISDATQTIEECQIPAVTITSFENLMVVLRALAREGGFYVGCCCQPFFTKHQDDFDAAGIPGILIDIDNTTCYELDSLKNGYAGTFEGFTRVNVPLLQKVIRAVM